MRSCEFTRTTALHTPTRTWHAAVNRASQPARLSLPRSVRRDAGSPDGRLYSNVTVERGSGVLRHDPGSVAGAALLVAGTAVGAGILVRRRS
jgi:hypothetical protein